MFLAQVLSHVISTLKNTNPDDGLVTCAEYRYVTEGTCVVLEINEQLTKRVRKQIKMEPSGARNQLPFCCGLSFFLSLSVNLSIVQYLK